MADKIRVPYQNPDGSVTQEIGTLMEVTDSKEPWSEYTLKEMITPVFAKTIRNLLNIRNHLLLQMDLECGNVSEEYFDKEEPKYLSEVEKIPLEKLKEEIKVLFGFTDLPFDSVDISEILNCSIDDAEKAINQYIGGV